MVYSARQGLWWIARGIWLILLSSQVLATPHKTIDLRHSTDTNGSTYSISFCARPTPGVSLSLPGHAFVAYSEVRGGIHTYLAVGHTTHASLAKTLLSYSTLISASYNVSGGLAEEIYTSVQEECLVILVNQKDYQRLLDRARPAITGELPSFGKNLTVLDYKLGVNDCIAFMIDVIKGLPQPGVKIPGRKSTELPLSYIRRVIDSN